MKFIIALRYNIKLKDWDMNYINAVVYMYNNVLRDIYLQIQKLSSNIPDEQQQF